MTPISKHINELWTITIKMSFFAETYNKFAKTIATINNTYYTLKNTFDKNDPNNTRNTRIIQHKT